jgi:hypothetical protein
MMMVCMLSLLLLLLLLPSSVHTYMYICLRVYYIRFYTKEALKFMKERERERESRQREREIERVIVNTPHRQHPVTPQCLPLLDVSMLPEDT